MVDIKTISVRMCVGRAVTMYFKLPLTFVIIGTCAYNGKLQASMRLQLVDHAPKNSGHAYIGAVHDHVLSTHAINIIAHFIRVRSTYGSKHAKKATSCHKARNYAVKCHHPMFLGIQ